MKTLILGGSSGRLGAKELPFHSMWEGTVAFARVGCSETGPAENSQWLRKRRMMLLLVGLLLPGVYGWLLLLLHLLFHAHGAEVASDTTPTAVLIEC